MPNIHGLHDNKSSNDDSEDDTEKRFVGGVDSRGGGSGLAVLPSNDDKKSSSSASDSIFNRANADTAASGGSGGGSGGEVRRTITMYRSGFTVDDGPYRQLNDPNNSEFLTALARGMIPRELSEEAGGDGEVAVGLVDKRGEEYDPEKHGSSGGSGGGGSGFQSFSGEGQSLAASARPMVMAGVIDPNNAGTPQPVDESRPTTSIAIRLLNGKRIVVKVNLDAPVLELGQHIGDQAGSDSYVLTSGYPPATIDDLGKTVEEAGLKGAQVVLKKA